MFRVPDNLIPKGCDEINPSMLPLVTLSGEEIDRIVSCIPGGAKNVQDIYPLGPLQEGILFHHMMSPHRDPYVLLSMLKLDGDDRVEELLSALQFIVNRHDVLRTAIMWEGLSVPVQVVVRQANLRVTRTEAVRNGAGLEEIQARCAPEVQYMDLGSAPLLQVQITRVQESSQHFVLIQLHHIVSDHVGFEIIQKELSAYLAGEADSLPVAASYRSYIAQALSMARTEVESYFQDKLGDFDEPSLPFNLVDVHGNGSRTVEERVMVSKALSQRLRDKARELHLSPAVLFHAAFALVVSGCSNRDDVVFGSLVSGRMQGTERADSKLGVYVNTLPLRVRLREVRVEELLRQVQLSLLELQTYEQAPLVLAQKSSGLAAGTPLFSALLNYRHSVPVEEAASLESPVESSGVEVIGGQERTNYPFVLSVDDLGDAFGLEIQVDCSVSSSRILAYIQKAVEGLVEALDHSSEQWVSDISILPSSEREQQLTEWNDTATPYNTDVCLHELFEQQVTRDGKATAAVFDSEALSYAELNARANRLAHYLAEVRGVKPGSLVGICLYRSLEMIVGILGILKAGGAYVPLDPDYPETRLRYMIEDSGLTTIITTDGLCEHAGITTEQAVNLDAADVKDALERQPGQNPEVGVLGLTPAHLAYVIYTSGSTGQPKGVMVEHGAIVNRIEWMDDEYGSSSADRILQKTPFSFDVSVWEFFWPLSVGACLILAKPGGHKDPQYLIELICSAKVTKLHFVPSMLSSMLSVVNLSQCESLRQVFCSGEALSLTLAREFSRGCPDVELHNLYGPTEAAIDVSYWHCLVGTEDLTRIPIGRPIHNIQLHVLNSRLCLIPTGAAGELHIGGVGLARGYLNKAELTSERFIENPFYDAGNPGSSERLYKTGDLVRWLPDGTLEFLGRIDEQVKIRGHRIEPGEIAASLSGSGLLRDALVLAVESATGDKRLVAYVVAEEADEEIDSRDLLEQLRGHVAKALPEYMCPSVYVVLESLPLTPNGKLDRRALPAPDAENEQAVYEAPRTETEKMLCHIWKAVLGVDRVGITDNFFQLGGHSLLATRLVSRINQQFDIDLSVKNLFAAPSISELTNTLKTMDIGVRPALVPVERKDSGVIDLLRQIWQDTLEIKQIGLHDDFFKLGGHSLTALKMLHQVKELLGAELRITDTYQNPTLSQLAALIGGDATTEEYVALAQEASLDDDIESLPGRPKNPPAAILLTGATGFIGRFLLRRLLDDNEQSKIYCLVRASSQQHAAARLKDTLSQWDLWRRGDEDRLVAIPGDIVKPRLGLNADDYRYLAEAVDSIFHCATSVNHLENYATAKAANVDSVNDLLRLATTKRPKLLNFISTLSVFNSQGQPEGRVVDEASPISAENHLAANGYETSKWVAEKIISLAQDRAVRCNIYRLGLVWADSEKGRFDAQQREYRVLESCVLAGCGITDYAYDMQPVPVDYVVDAISLLAEQNPQGGQIFHIGGTEGSVTNICACLDDLPKSSLKPLSWFNWIKEVQALHNQGHTLPAVPFVEFGFSMDQNAFEDHQMNAVQSRTLYDWKKTREELELSGLETPVFDRKMIRLALDHILTHHPYLKLSGLLRLSQQTNLEVL